MPSVSDLMQKFDRNRRSLLRDAAVVEIGTVAVNTPSGAHLKADCDLPALETRNNKHLASINDASEIVFQ